MNLVISEFGTGFKGFALKHNTSHKSTTSN